MPFSESNATPPHSVNKWASLWALAELAQTAWHLNSANNENLEATQLRFNYVRGSSLLVSDPLIRLEPVIQNVKGIGNVYREDVTSTKKYKGRFIQETPIGDGVPDLANIPGRREQHFFDFVE